MLRSRAWLLAVAAVAVGCTGEVGEGDDDAPRGRVDDPPTTTDPPPVTPPAAVDCTHKGSGTDYVVGPGQAYESLGDVPFESLRRGDTVRIFHRAEPYREKIMIGGEASTDDPIRVCGVPGPNGELPVIDGAGATTRSSVQFPYEGHESRGVVVIGHPNDAPYEQMPGPIVLEGLAITGGRADETFTNTSGAQEGYSDAVAGVFVQRGRGITIRGCEIFGNANGIFAGTSAGDEGTYDVLVEANHVYDNGTPGSDRQHNSYNEVVGIVYQFNRFGAPRADSGAGNVKDRSAGVVFRYNYVESGGHLLDLVDAQEARSTTVAMPEFHESFVYGNVFVRADAGGSMIHYGGDSGIFDDYRKGTLYFFHNTVFVGNQSQQDYDEVAVFELSTNDENLWSRNNLYALAAPTTPYKPVVLLGRRDGEVHGIADLAGDWIANGMTPSAEIPGVPVPFDGEVVGFEPRPGGSDPLLVNASGGDLHPAEGSPLIAAGVSLMGVVADGYLPHFAYDEMTSGVARDDAAAPTIGGLTSAP